MGHEVAVEVLVLRASVDGRLAYRRQVAPLLPDAAPDDAAIALVGGAAVLHSTSWRRDPAWGLVLTYAALPDPRENCTTAVELDGSGLAAGVEAHAPTPPAVSVDQVAAHAVRHLALLRRTDPVVATALAAYGQLDAAIAAADPLPAGQLT